ncbi:MAG: hypothetical protein A2821_00860 [Candidatus Magasanikbacteria bacterium RIFCSPHIGHO2_01_FULL_41_23]|uniref:DEAD/DEAH box helicase n=1 Tax=Candidatus Magasanikbacteria bacterium RIFCSPLOWO2_01_FULL_40_15 TaxID=1798686 RepID=A0A1F6N0I8_9BACT|nr:MAG: hypothetical protein A2821_00860 [Candidatus Magasanikbacteria bacterium RIFCSPHIGHO2_01_FULL_41_23]OGH74725.1 MAG: hypothetical protein A3F22_02215 [Candidatus Magasanikbacteria bacterium RIFCSPHIGHO2_12_FULL_41_16]OGH77439.1 MAG: hypothetical protein A2983_01915 [Candidatus Magasanikbacteria bacterium RIFCSPLOWO2_01_FULL_40_15]
MSGHIYFMEHTKDTSGFAALGLANKLLEVLIRHKYTVPTPIQEQAIPIALLGKDLVGIAQTGTGKTLAFGLPMIQRLAQVKGQGLVLVPTRELALQVEETLRQIGTSVGLKTAVVIGGASMHKQIQELRRNPHIIVATPGRLADHLKQKTVSLSAVSVVVLDEADRMFDIGFAPQIKQILSLVPVKRQTLLFSATMPSEIVQIAHKFMQAPQRVEVSPAGTAAAPVVQSAYVISKEGKTKLLQAVLDQVKGTVLVFSRTKHGAKKIASNVRQMKHSSTEIHSNRSLAQRKAALHGFKTGIFRVLIATDIAARGIDVKNIELVINFDLPDNLEDYVHRIGRTGRAGSAGKAISFVEPNQRFELRNIERLTRKSITVLALPDLSVIPELPKIPYQKEFASQSRPQYSANSGRGSYPSRTPQHTRGGAPRRSSYR